MKNFFIYIFAFSFFSVLIFSQVNTEKHRTPKDAVGFSGHIEVDANIKTGNTEKTEVGVEGRGDYKTPRSLTFIIFQSDYEWVGSTRSSDMGLLHLRHVENFNDSLMIEFFGQIDYNKKILLNNRELIGAGLRYRLFNFSNGDIHIGSAFMFEHENYNLDETDSHPDEVQTSRWSNYLTYFQAVNANVTLSSVLYYQPAFSDFGDVRILNENNMKAGLSQSLSVLVTFRLRYDSIPPDEIEKTDTETRIGLSYSF